MKEKDISKKTIKNNLFYGVCILALLLLIGLIAFIIASVFMTTDENNAAPNTDVSSDSQVESSETELSSQTNEQSTVQMGNYLLDANYTNLLLVNGNNALAEDYDYEGNLVTVDEKYINGSLKQISKDIEPYILAMIEDAWADGVELYIWSPYRSYETQKMLYENQVKRCLEQGLGQEEAENKAATVVARPGTSEHHTGLAVDFNMADDRFEETDMYLWLEENAAQYGFIMRYSADKQDITGVIHESWHWRFVGINTAKEIKSLGMCLEEYIDYLNK